MTNHEGVDMSKVQCFKLPDGSFNSRAVYVVVDLIVNQMFGFTVAPEQNKIKKIQNLCFAYSNDEVDALIIHLANKPEKIWEVEV